MFFVRLVCAVVIWNEVIDRYLCEGIIELYKKG
jgi:hypothetical protein